MSNHTNTNNANIRSLENSISVYAEYRTIESKTMINLTYNARDS